MNAAETSTPRGWQIFFLAGFALLLGAPLLGWILRVRPPANFQEMQTLAPFPAWKTTPTADWPAKFESWLKDHFPLRERLVQAHSVVVHRWFHAPSANVLVGRDDWLFYIGDRTLEDFAGRDRFSEAELERWNALLEGRRAWLRERGIAYLFVIVPNKSTIYPEKMPALLQASARPGKLDQLLAYLRAKKSSVPVLDLRPTLFAQKARERVYWTADSHWNASGLKAASEAIVTRIQSLGIKAGAADQASALKSETTARDADCADLLGMRDLWPRPPETQLRLLRPADLLEGKSPLSSVPPWPDAPWWKKPVVSDRVSAHGRIVLLCDSFFRAGGVPLDALGQVPFMAAFQRFTSLWEWADFEQIKAIAELEKPDIVVEEWTERYLKVIPADHAEFARARAVSASP